MGVKIRNTVRKRWKNLVRIKPGAVYNTAE